MPKTEWTIRVCPSCGRESDGLTYCWDCEGDEQGEALAFQPIQVVAKGKENA